MNYSYIAGAISIAVLITGAIIVIIKKPYSETHSNLRAVINYTIGAILMAICIYLNIKG